MALPNIMRRLFRSDGYGPLLKPEIIPFASDLASNAADVAASTEWVKDLASTAVYLDPNGVDTNNGFSSSSPVKTFTKAISIINDLPQHHVSLFVSGGTYNEDVSILNQRISIYLEGNVTLNGSLQIEHHSNILFYDESGTFSFTINSTKNALIVDSNSSILVYVPFAANVSGGGDYTGIRLHDHSYALFTETLSLNCVVGNGWALLVDRNSYIHCGKQVTAVGSSTSERALQASKFSAAYFSNGFNASEFYGAGGLAAEDNSVVQVENGVTAFTHKQGHGIYVGRYSCIAINSPNSFTVDCSSIGVCIGIYEFSFFLLNINSGKTGLIKANSSNMGIYTSEGSYSAILGAGTLTFNGPYNRVTRTTYGSMMYISSDLTLNGNATGQRYDIYVNGVVSVGGAGTNRIPGSIAGYNAGSSQICYYN